MKQGLIFILLTALFAAAQNSPDASVSETKIMALENAWGQAEKLDDSKASARCSMILWCTSGMTAASGAKLSTSPA